MTRKRRSSLEGQLVTLEHVSKVLEDNALGDPHVRPLNVWLPPQYHQGLSLIHISEPTRPY